MRLHRSFCCFSLLWLAAGCSGTEREDTDATGAVAGTSGSSNGGSTSAAAGTGGAGASGAAGAAGTSGTGVGGGGGSGAGVGGGASAGSAGSGGSTSTASSLGEVLTAELYASMFPNRNALYGYEALIAAGAAYPDFGSVGTFDERRREVAAFFGNAAHETTGGWDTAPGGPEAWGLYFIEEVGCDAGACMQYCDATNERYPCQPGKTYHGRGPIQLSWNFNYGALGEVLGLPLLESPELVTSDGEVAFTTALWFWMTPQPPKPSAHDVMLGRWSPSSADTAAGRTPGFGMTVNIINGGLECGMATDDRVRDRIRFYRHFATLLGTTVGDDLECATMQSY